MHDALRTHGIRWLEQYTLPAGLSAEPLAAVVIGAGIGIHQQWLWPRPGRPRKSLYTLEVLVTMSTAS
jgi:TetR/AcrR family acrAB operon transcriptional repressor